MDIWYFIPFYHFNFVRTWFVIILGNLKLGGMVNNAEETGLYAGFEEVTIRNEEENSWGDGEVE